MSFLLSCFSPSPPRLPTTTNHSMMNRSLLLAALLYGVSGQARCSSYDCATCLSDPSCYYSNCGYGSCTSSNNPSYSGECNGVYPTKSCPAVPAAAEAARPISLAYGMLSLGVVAAGVTAILSYSSIEQLCGQIISSHSSSSFGYNQHLLFLSCCFLWFGLSLSLASPLLPWLVSANQKSTVALTAFHFLNCPNDPTNEGLCATFPLTIYITKPPTADAALVQNGRAFGILVYITSVGLLFPCALMTSAAVYRLSKLAKYGTPPFTSGCSPASLLVAQLLGWPSFLIFAIIFFCAISLSSTAAIKLNAERKYDFGPGSGEYQHNLMPGVVAGGVSLALQLLGLALQTIVARSLSAVYGVGCNSGGCSRCCGFSFGKGRGPFGDASHHTVVSPLAHITESAQESATTA